MAIEGIKSSTRAYVSSKSNDSKQRESAISKGRSDAISLDKFERGAQRDEIKYERRQARKARKEKESPATPTTPPTASPEAPVEVAPTQPTTPGSDPQSYAQKYVALYEKNSGHTLSSTERAEKIEAVAAFYSDPARSNRLETLVNGLS